MTIEKILGAKDALGRLASKQFSTYKKAREIAKLKKVVDEEVAIYVAEEKKAVDKYSEKDDKGEPVFLNEGRIKLKDVQAKLEFDKEILELRSSDIGKLEPIQLTEADFKQVDDVPTPEDMILLEGLVNFID